MEQLTVNTTRNSCLLWSCCNCSTNLFKPAMALYVKRSSWYILLCNLFAPRGTNNTVFWAIFGCTDSKCASKHIIGYLLLLTYCLSGRKNYVFSEIFVLLRPNIPENTHTFCKTAASLLYQILLLISMLFQISFASTLYSHNPRQRAGLQTCF